MSKNRKSKEQPFHEIVELLCEAEETGQPISINIKPKGRRATGWRITKVVIISPKADQVLVYQFQMIKLTEIIGARPVSGGREEA